MEQSLLQTQFLENFTCLGDACEDTCCKGWGMQVDAATVAKYKAEAPELLDAVTSGEAEHIMKRDPETDYCIKFDKGWCGVHAAKGTEFLGDACHFFPRVTRKLGKQALPTASISCPEVTRLVLFSKQPFATNDIQADRLPHSIKDYLPEGMDAAGVMKTHQAFLNAALEEGVTAERSLARMVSVAESLPRLPLESWPDASAMYLKLAEGRLPEAQMSPVDGFNCYHALAGLVSAAKPSTRERLQNVMENMRHTLNITVDDAMMLHLAPDSHERLAAVQASWKAVQDDWQPVLKRWVAAQISMALFPFSGLGESLTERVVILAVRFATVKLALQTHLHSHGNLSEEDAVRIIQSLARFLDHLADPTLSLQIYAETGWNQLPRLRGLLGDA